VKKLVGVGYFPGGDALGIVYDTASPQLPSVGPVISTSIVEWSAADPSSFFLLQDGGYAAPVARLVGLLRGSSWLDLNKLTEPAPMKCKLEWPRKSQRLGNPSVPYASTRAPSCPDDLLQAYLGGAFDPLVPPQVKGIKAIIAERMSGPLVLPAVVSETIRSATLARVARFGLLRHPAALAGTLLWRCLLGKSETVAPRAIQALLEGGRLPPEELASQIAGYAAKKPEHRAVLLAMGRDAALGALHYDAKAKRLIADLNLVELTPGYSKQEALMTDVARELGGELRTSPTWNFLRKPITVHNQGGCRMSDHWKYGVTNEFGKVHHCRGLYILDGAILCKSVGVNPSATIAALAERGVHHFISKFKPGWPNGDNSSGATEYVAQRKAAERWAKHAKALGWDLEPPAADANGRRPKSNTRPIGLKFEEESNGYYHPTDHRPKDRAGFISQENRGRPDFPIELSLKVEVENLAAFFEDPRHLMQVEGTVNVRLPDRNGPEQFQIRDGQVSLFVAMPKPYAIRPQERYRYAAQERATRSSYASVPDDGSKPQDRLMRYSLPFQDETGRFWALHGHKQISSTTSLDAWRQTSIIVLELSGQDDAQNGALVTRGAGAVHVDLMSFLYKQLKTVEATGTNDPMRSAWAVTEFSAFFFGTLQRIYLPAVNAMIQSATARGRLDRYQP
jgi:cholesterol oxidase